MIDTRLRIQLSQDLRRLVTGRMTNDQFDDVCYDEYFESTDRGVREIARFGWSLYSSDVLFAYRLRGRHAVDDSTRKMAALSVLFLQTDNEYEYAETSCSVAAAFISCAWFNGSLVGIAFVIMGGLAIVGGDFQMAVGCISTGLWIIAACLAVGWAHGNLTGLVEEENNLMERQNLWPFFDSKSLAMANANDYLLSNFKPCVNNGNR